MTPRSEAIYQFVQDYHAKRGYAPTRREIGRWLKLSTSVVSYQLTILQDAGRLMVARGVARGIVLMEAPTEADDASESPEGDWQVANRMATPSTGPSRASGCNSGRGK